MAESNLLLGSGMTQNNVGYSNHHLSGQMNTQGGMGYSNNKNLTQFPCAYRLTAGIGMGEQGLGDGSTMNEQASPNESGCRSVGKIEPEDLVS